MFSSAVCCSDSFYDLSTEAQALYFQLGFEADNDGVVLSIRSAARKCGYSKEQVSSLIGELVDGGYLLEILDAHLITHWWTNNNKDKCNYREGDRLDVMALVYEDQDTRAYRLITDLEEVDSLSSVFRQSDISPQYKVIEGNRKEGKANEAKRIQNKASEANKREGGFSAETKTAVCPTCGAECAAYESGGRLLAYCPSCNEDFEA